MIEASGSSLLIFGGAAQFAAVSLVRDGATALETAATVFLINLRHALMAASLRPFLTSASVGQRLGYAYILTDEAFAMGIGWFRRGHRDIACYVTFGAALWLCWNVGTIAGAIGAGIPEPQRYGIDFAITACFVATVAVVIAGAVAPLVLVLGRRER